MSHDNPQHPELSATIALKDLGTVRRLGFGAMRIVGDGVWGEPADRAAAVAVVRRAVELGVDFIDTADSYGPNISEEILAEALHPYRDGLKIATKVGFTRTGPNVWVPVGRPEYLRQQTELSLRKLKVDSLDLLQLHRIDPKVDREEQFAVLRDLQKEGKVKALGLSQVSVEELEEAGKYFTVSTVQNRYNLTDRSSEDVLEYAEENGIGFIPWAPISAGELARPGGPLDEAAKRLGATTSQVALAWLLRRSPVMMPIPGTGSVKHLEENLAAAGVVLDDATYRGTRGGPLNRAASISPIHRAGPAGRTGTTPWLNILMVVSAANSLTMRDGSEHPTGYWAEELVVSHQTLLDAGHTVHIATPGGRKPTVDEVSLAAESAGGQDRADSFRTYLESIDAELSAPLVLADVDVADYDAVVMPGGHGPMADLYQDADLGRILCRRQRGRPRSSRRSATARPGC